MWTVVQVWISFFRTFAASVPRIGMTESMDCIFVQAFGRNHFTDDELGGIINSLILKCGNDDYALLQALDRMNFNPGKANRALARYVMKIVEIFDDLPVIISQWEVVYAIYEIDLKWYLDHRQKIDAIWPPHEGYFATWHVKLASREKMRARALSRPFEVAHPAMIARTIPILWAIDVNPIVEQISSGNAVNHELWVWDEDSIQPWTCNFAAWKKRELLGRLGHVATHIWGVRQLIFAIKPHLPRHLQQMIPGNWIRFFPPRHRIAESLP